MSIKEQLPMNRTSITIVVLVVLCAAGLAYSQGWFDWSSSSYEMEGNEVGTGQTIDQENRTENATPVTQPTMEPAATPAK